MGSNMMPASGIHYLDPVIFPELFEKIGYTNGRKGDLFKVGISTNYPYLSMVRTGRKKRVQPDAIRNIVGAIHQQLAHGAITNGEGAFKKSKNLVAYSEGKWGEQESPNIDFDASVV